MDFNAKAENSIQAGFSEIFEGDADGFYKVTLPRRSVNSIIASWDDKPNGNTDRF